MRPVLIHEGKLDRAAAAELLRTFLEKIVRAGGFDLQVNVRVVDSTAGAEEGAAEVLADLDGKDKEILLARSGEVLKALEHLAFRVLGLEPAFHDRIHLDSGGYRALRFEELKMTAKVAAERVQASRQSFQLNPMSSRERRIVHLALKDIPGVRTESIGTGEERQVVIHAVKSDVELKR
jgi:spoIIIJ-associated protein